MTTSRNDTGIHARLTRDMGVAVFDIGYVQFDEAGDVVADFVTSNFEVVSQLGTTDGLSINGGFSATVWRGSAPSPTGNVINGYFNKPIDTKGTVDTGDEVYVKSLRTVANDDWRIETC